MYVCITPSPSEYIPFSTFTSRSRSLHGHSTLTLRSRSLHGHFTVTSRSSSASSSVLFRLAPFYFIKGHRQLDAGSAACVIYCRWSGPIAEFIKATGAFLPLFLRTYLQFY